MKLEGKKALVTGSSKGIGREIAIRFAREGADVVINYNSDPKGADEALAEVTALGRKGAALQANLGVTTEVRGLVAKSAELLGGLDILVNNAGIEKHAQFWDVTEADYDAVLNVNLKGVFFATQAFVQGCRAAGTQGRIVNISSVLGLIPSPFSALYASSKHAIEGYSESLDHEVRASGIRVVLVEPAYTRTGFDSNSLVADQLNDHYAAARANAEAVLRAVAATADSPDVVAEAVVIAATATTPRLRYTAGSMARKVSLLRRFVPASAFDKSLRKQLQMPA